MFLSKYLFTTHEAHISAEARNNEIMAERSPPLILRMMANNGEYFGIMLAHCLAIILLQMNQSNALEAFNQPLIDLPPL